MRRLGFDILVGLLVLLVMATSINAKLRATKSSDTLIRLNFHELVDSYFNQYFKANPSQATGVGFHQYDRQLEDFSLSAHRRNRRRLSEYLTMFTMINPRTLSQLERDDREIMMATIHSLLLEED